MDDSVSRCRICHLYWQFGELHLRCAQGRTAALQRLLVPVMCVRCITALQPVVSGTQLLRKRGPMRVFLQLFLHVQHDGQRELDVLLLSELTSYRSSDRFVFSSGE